MSDPPQAMKSKGLKFAKKQLKKHGWKKGKGLGKRENGISEAIRVKVKCDTAGVGHNAAEQFTFHWWDHLFNTSAANIAVEDGKDEVKVKKVSEAITTKKPRKLPGDKNLLYGRFVKAATLTSSGEEPLKPASFSDSSEEEEEKLDLSTARRLTDEELIQACGGRTAHKGARHGVTMSAKLARLEEQERAFLASYEQLKEKEPMVTETPFNSTRLHKRAKKAKRKKAARERDFEIAVCERLEAREEEEEEEKPKKSRGAKESERLPVDSPEAEDRWTEMAAKRGKRRKAKRKQQQPPE